MAWLQRLLETGQQRWTKLGDVASLLEPNLKDGRGGLRDYDMLRQVRASQIERIDFLSPADATQRYGTSSSGAGAIIIRTRSGA